ncbi:MAG: response regulator [Holophaga sp.]|nr:response regulator [Holophaga sp.]
MISPSEIFHGKILVVDDQEANVSLLVRMLGAAGFDSVFSTMEPTQVCELHLINHYDLILLDLQMPGMDGFQVMENLKEIEKGSYLPVLVITANPEHKLRALKAGAKDFLSKPLDLAEVLLRVHNMLEVRMLHQDTKRLYDRVVAEQKVSERLLMNLLPNSILQHLKGHPNVMPDETLADTISEGFAEVTVLFADILAFTTFAEGASAKVLGGVLNDISTHFDTTYDPYAKEIINTIGEAHLASVGLSDSVANRSIRASRMALGLVEAVQRFNSHSRYKLKLRIGFDTGEVSPAEGKRVFFRDL